MGNLPAPSKRVLKHVESKTFARPLIDTAIMLDRMLWRYLASSDSGREPFHLSIAVSTVARIGKFRP
jgi:hypothetical protein